MTAPDRYVRPAITFVVGASGLKYVGVGTTALGWILCAVLRAAAASWLIRSRPWQPAVELAQLDVADVTPQPDTDLLRAPD